MSERFTCWHCGNALLNVILPMSRREECAQCRADQHVCKMCVHFDNKGICTEDRAEDISDREKANFCDYFQPENKEFSGSVTDKSQTAKAKLAALFGDPEPEPTLANTELSPAELAEKKLREMLGD